MYRKLIQLSTKNPVCHARCSTRTLNRKSAGLTLTEVVIASAILVIAMVPILKGLTSAYLATTRIERKTLCLIYSQSKLDEIKAKTVYNYSQSFSESNSSLDGSYLCNVADESAGSNLRKITVSTGFDLDGNDILDSEEIEVTLATYIAKRWDS